MNQHNYDLSVYREALDKSNKVKSLLITSTVFICAMSLIIELIGLSGHRYEEYLSALAVLVVAFWVYWYLQIKPSNRSVDILQKSSEIYYTLEDKLRIIKEIEDAVLLFKKPDASLEDVSKFIAGKLNVFPRNHELRKFDVSRLNHETSLELFKISLSTFKADIQEKVSRKKVNIPEEFEKIDELENSTDRLVKLNNIATSRLKEEVEALSKRANVYIVIGSVITIGSGVLLYGAIQDMIGSSSGLSSPSHDVTLGANEILSISTRLSIVVFAEVFAFYYLRLYREIMANIKYYQNEITNIEMKILALHAVESGNCTESLKVLSEELAKTERNFVIDKGKTTIDLERTRLDSDVVTKSLESFTKVIKGVKS
ncbi:hypothetical protein IOQ59_19915 [Pontibacterium sp. N1Y112]|uniref:Uncharacterized protein n=1 Tax=Pontibacterium sinense TaxID=2781979 RepID=A0A8J7FDL8_9GAMM|nr:hypothetical protein [Pontibacterium sinense]MBE9399535.1 hypothetical protein [Pontibacterium sinense]